MSKPRNEPLPGGPRTRRRDFFKLCMGAVALGTPGLAAPSAESIVNKYDRSLLINGDRTRLDINNLTVGKNYIFHYPFVGTPCFLLDLGEPVNGQLTLKTETDQTYQWNGGVGPNASLVAFSAICAHKMTHPAKSVSFISYRHDTTGFADKKLEQTQRSHIIYCCSERSVYDARRGAQVLGGPARQPLATILLDYDAEHNELYAVGTAGGELFNRFFQKFRHRLELEYERKDIARTVGGHTEVVPLEQFSKAQKQC